MPWPGSTLRLLGLLAAALTAAAAGTAGWLPAGRAPAVASERVPGPVVVVGVAGLTWQDVDRTGTPTLWRLAGQSAAGSMSARVDSWLTCPTEAWLTIGAGSRVKALPPGNPAPPGPGGAGPTCRPYPATVATGNGTRAVAGWSRLRDVNARGGYRTTLGALPRIVRAHGGCIGAVGQGALLATATPDGTVTRQRGPMSALPGLAGDCPLVFVDAGVRVTPARADATAAEVLRAVPGATVFVLGISDRHDYAQMHVALASGPSAGAHPYAGRWLGSASTRRDDIVQLTDVTPTLLTLLGYGDARTAQMVGTPMRATQPYDASTADVVDLLREVDVANKVSRDLTPGFVTAIEAIQLLVYLAAAVALRRRWPTSTRRRTMLRAVRTIALAGAAVPVATFLANLVPWWSAAYPGATLVAGCAAFVAAVLAVALAGPWRRHPIGPPTAVAATTAAVLGADVLTGSHLQLSSVLGYPVVIGARFYGFGNIMFALFATGTLLFLAGLYHWLATTIGHGAGLASVVLLGAFAVVLDGSPAWGSDAGGVVAFVPGVAVLALLLTGRRLNVRWLAAICAAAVAVVALLAYVDYRRPRAEQSHLGRFFGQLVTGDAWPLVARKLGANLHILVSSYGLTLLVVAAALFLAFVLLRPVEPHGVPLRRVFEIAPPYRAGLLAVLVTLAVGAVLNDSGIAVPAMGMALGVPLAVAASARAVEADEPAPTESPSAQPAATPSRRHAAT